MKSSRRVKSRRRARCAGAEEQADRGAVFRREDAAGNGRATEADRSGRGQCDGDGGRGVLGGRSRVVERQNDSHPRILRRSICATSGCRTVRVPTCRPKSASLRLAVLIDADNASAKIVDGLFEEIAKIGQASLRRIYGDFTSARLKEWTGVLAKHAIIPHLHLSNTTGKNASDIALVIDAMDLLHSGIFDGFCLVSSDSDFTRLASRIREQGKDVFGFGEQKTPESFRQACGRFIYTENLLAGAQGAARKNAPCRSRALLRRLSGRRSHRSRVRTAGQRLVRLASSLLALRPILIREPTAPPSSAIWCGRRTLLTSTIPRAALCAFV